MFSSNIPHQTILSYNIRRVPYLVYLIHKAYVAFVLILQLNYTLKLALYFSFTEAPIRIEQMNKDFADSYGVANT